MRYLLLLPLLLAGCASPVGQKTVVQLRNDAYALKTTYALALQGAVSYAELPSCSKAPPPCSDDGTVKAMQAAKNKASPLVNDVEKIALSATPDTSALQLSVTAATTAVADLQKLLLPK